MNTIMGDSYDLVISLRKHSFETKTFLSFLEMFHIQMIYRETKKESYRSSSDITLLLSSKSMLSVLRVFKVLIVRKVLNLIKAINLTADPKLYNNLNVQLFLCRKLNKKKWKFMIISIYFSSNNHKQFTIKLTFFLFIRPIFRNHMYYLN